MVLAHMVIKKTKANNESFVKGIIYDYPLPDEKIGVSYQEHNGRLPEIGWGVNKINYDH